MTSSVLLLDLSRRDTVKAAIWRERGGIVAQNNFYVDSVETFEAGVLDFLDQQDAPFLTAAAVSAPGWEHDGIQHMPNHGFTFNRERLRQIFNVKRLHIVNTSLARALGISVMQESDFDILCEGVVEPEQVKGIISVGRGMNMSMLVPDSMGGWCAFAGAGGHSDLTDTYDVETAILTFLFTKYGHVSRERVVSMQGLGEIWQALIAVEGRSSEIAPEPEVIIRLAGDGDAFARKCVNLCTGWLAASASDTALIMGARGGIYLAGTLIEALNDHMDRALFRSRYVSKGRLSDYVSTVPVFSVTGHNSDLLGLTTLFA
ncbi:MAG: glucokinase [Asticcacaulis sp.]